MKPQLSISQARSAIRLFMAGVFVIFSFFFRTVTALQDSTNVPRLRLDVSWLLFSQLPLALLISLDTHGPTS